MDISQKGFVAGYVTAMIITLAVVIVVSLSVAPLLHPALVLRYQKLRDNKVPITLNERGEFWLWNEAAKESTKLSDTDFERLALKVK